MDNTIEDLQERNETIAEEIKEIHDLRIRMEKDTHTIADFIDEQEVLIQQLNSEIDKIGELKGIPENEEINDKQKTTMQIIDEIDEIIEEQQKYVKINVEEKQESLKIIVDEKDKKNLTIDIEEDNQSEEIIIIDDGSYKKYIKKCNIL